MDQILRKNEKTRWKRNLKLCSISGSFTHRPHVLNRQMLFVPRQESFPIPSNCIDVVRHSQTNLDTFQKHNIDDDRNVDGARPLSGSFIGFTRFTILKNPSAPWTHVCRRIDYQICKLLLGLMTFGQKYGGKHPNFVNERQDSNGTLKNNIDKHAKRKLETQMESAMPCKPKRNSQTQTLKSSMSTTSKILRRRNLVHPRKNNQIHFLLTKVILSNVDDAVSTKTANQRIKSLLQTVDTIL